MLILLPFQDGETALSWAASRGNCEVVAALLAGGAPVGVKDAVR